MEFLLHSFIQQNLEKSAKHKLETIYNLEPSGSYLIRLFLSTLKNFTDLFLTIDFIFLFYFDGIYHT